MREGYVLTDRELGGLQSACYSAANTEGSCEIPGHVGVRIMEEGGRDDCPVYQSWISDGWSGFDPQVGEGVNVAVIPWQLQSIWDDNLWGIAKITGPEGSLNIVINNGGN